MKHLIKFMAVYIIAFLPSIAHAQTVADTFCKSETGLDTNIVINGNFSSGNTGFSTTYISCSTGNCLFTLTDNGYSVGSDASFFHNYFTGSDHTTGTGNFMIINGQDSTRLVWGETLAVVPNSKYLFSMWISAMDNLPAPGAATIGILVNGSSIGTVSSPVTTGAWTQLQAIWYSGPSTTANIAIKDITSDWNGFDYGLDDIAFQRCPTLYTSAVNSVELKSVSIMPNPSNGVLNISNCPPESTIEIYDMIGKKIISTVTGTQSTAIVDMTSYPNGLYLVHITSSTNVTLLSQRVTINR